MGNLDPLLAGIKRVANLGVLLGVTTPPSIVLNFKGGLVASNNAVTGQIDVDGSGAGITYGADLSTTSTGTAQYVDALSYDATGAGHGAVQPIKINGTGAGLNFVDSAVSIAYEGATVLRLASTGTDFVSFGSSPATGAYLDFPDGASQTIAAFKSSPFLATDSANNLNFGWANDNASAGLGVFLFAQNAGGTTQNGGTVALVSGRGSTTGGPAGEHGSITFVFGGGGSGDAVTLLGAPTSAELGGMQWSQNLTPTLSQASQSTNVQGGDFTLSPQPSSHASNNGGGNLVVDLQAPNGSGVEAALKIKRGGSLAAAIGPYPGDGSGLSCLWIGPIGGTLTNSNWTIASDANNAFVNAPGAGGLTRIRTVGTDIALFTTTSVQLAQPLMGVASTSPLQYAVLSSAVDVSSGATLTAAQYANAVIVTTGALAGNESLLVPNIVGATWVFAIATTLSSFTLSIATATGSVTPGSITALTVANGRVSVRCVVAASGVIALG